MLMVEMKLIMLLILDTSKFKALVSLNIKISSHILCYAENKDILNLES